MKLAINTIILLFSSFISLSQKRVIPDGHTIDYNKDGTKNREGRYENGKKVGEWIFYSDGKDTSHTIRWLEGRHYYMKFYSKDPNLVDMEGVMEEYDKNGEVKTRPVGRWVSYYFKEGKRYLLKDVIYKSGKLHGTYLHNEVAFNARIEGHFLDSQKAGEWNYYDLSTGKLYAVEHYDYGQRDGRYRYYNRYTGKLQIKGAHAKDMRNGEWSHFDSATGKCLRKEEYLAGTLHGSFSRYNKDGRLLESGQYQKGTKVGTWKYYNEENGDLATTRNFDKPAMGFSGVGPDDWKDTVYYNSDLFPGAKKATAKYYRPPVERIDSVHYRVSYYRTNGRPYMTVIAIPEWAEDRYSLEIGKAIYDGHAVFYDTLGRKRTEGDFKNGQKSGEWIAYRTGGTGIEYAFVHLGNNNFYVKIYDHSPNALASEGRWEKYKEKGKRETLRLKGKWVSYHHNGDSVYLQKEVWYNNEGKLHGDLRYYDSATETMITKGQYQNGIHEGVWLRYDGASGRLIESSEYKKGMLHGKLTEWDTAGNILTAANYKNGQLHKERKLYFAGTNRLKGEGVFKKGSGITTYYDSATGSKILTGRLENGKRNGEWRRYYPGTNKLMRLSNHKNGKLHGSVIEYDTAGMIIAKDEFENGYYKKMIHFYDGTENPWIEYIFSADTYRRLQELTTFYPSGKVKRKHYLNEAGKFEGHCFDEYGEELPFTPIRSNPQFPGDVMTYIGNNLKYPEEAKDMRLEGKVVVSFIVNENGTLSDIHVQKGFDQRCDEEAVRIVSSMPLWKPAEIDGKPFKMQQTLPIVFWLPEEKPDME